MQLEGHLTKVGRGEGEGFWKEASWKRWKDLPRSPVTSQKKKLRPRADGCRVGERPVRGQISRCLPLSDLEAPGVPGKDHFPTLQTRTLRPRAVK